MLLVAPLTCFIFFDTLLMTSTSPASLASLVAAAFLGRSSTFVAFVTLLTKFVLLVISDSETLLTGKKKFNFFVAVL